MESYFRRTFSPDRLRSRNHVHVHGCRMTTPANQHVVCCGCYKPLFGGIEIRRKEDGPREQTNNLDLKSRFVCGKKRCADKALCKLMRVPYPSGKYLLLMENFICREFHGNPLADSQSDCRKEFRDLLANRDNRRKKN